jgi:acyl-CoA thioester hydrolase
MFIAWDYPTPFTREIVVQETDIDGLGHTNNASYVIWCEQCAWLHSESLGLSVHDYQSLDRGLAIHHAEYDYFLPSFAGDPLISATWLVACDGRLRLERRFQIVHRDTGTTVLRGHWNLVSVVLSTGRVTRLPKLFVDNYSAAVVSPAGE